MRLRVTFLYLAIVFLSLAILLLKIVSLFEKNSTAPIITPVLPSPTPIVLKQAVPADSYTIIMVGDSMTEALGLNSDKLREYLKAHYPNKTFGIFNLAKGSTNILSVQEILEKDILPSREFEVILIESFGYNPLSTYPLETGLNIQTQALDKMVSTIRTVKQRAKVNSIIVFVATIAPNRESFGKGAIDLPDEERVKSADERSAYIKNHIEYAKSRDIPLINIYEKSLKDGTGNPEYIKGDTFIHPSAKGVDFISREIADFLFNNRVLPP